MKNIEEEYSELSNNISKEIDLHIKQMKKRLTLHIAMFVLLMIALIFTIVQVNQQVDKEEKEITSLMGKQVIISQDTLIIIDYSLLHNTFKLSNGVDYEMSYIKQKVK